MGTLGIIALSVCVYLIIGQVCATIGDIINVKIYRIPLDDVVHGVMPVMWPFMCVLFMGLGAFKVSRQLSSAVVRLLLAKRKEC